MCEKERETGLCWEEMLEQARQTRVLISYLPISFDTYWLRAKWYLSLGAFFTVDRLYVVFCAVILLPWEVNSVGKMLLVSRNILKVPHAAPRNIPKNSLRCASRMSRHMSHTVQDTAIGASTWLTHEGGGGYFTLSPACILNKTSTDRVVSTDVKMAEDIKAKLENYRTAPFDARFPNQNQTRNCWANYLGEPASGSRSKQSAVDLHTSQLS